MVTLAETATAKNPASMTVEMDDTTMVVAITTEADTTMVVATMTEAGTTMEVATTVGVARYCALHMAGLRSSGDGSAPKAFIQTYE